MKGLQGEKAKERRDIDGLKELRLIVVEQREEEND